MENQNEIKETVVVEQKKSKKGIIATIVITVIGVIAGFFGVKALRNKSKNEQHDEVIENDINSDSTSNEE
jgi:hypothetical protein